jgi:hypothetical protein
VDIRTIASITSDSIQSWCSMPYLEERHPHFEVAQLFVTFRGETSHPEVRFSAEDPIFSIAGVSDPVSAMTLVNRSLQQNPSWAEALPHDGTRVDRQLAIDFLASELSFNLISPPPLVQRLIVVGKGHIQIDRRALKSALSYAAGSTQVAQVADYPVGTMRAGVLCV